MKDRTLWVTFGIGLAVLGAGAVFYRHNADSYQALPIEKLTTELEENYRRAIDVNGYMMNYRYRAPDTIVIVVKHYPDVNRHNMKDAIESAENMIKGMARDRFGMSYFRVRVEVETIEIPAGS